MEPCCGNCRYWNNASGEPPEKKACCRRYPPVVPATDGAVIESHFVGVFPVVYADNWCGEWLGRLGHDGQRLPKPDNLPDPHAAGPRDVPHG